MDQNAKQQAAESIKQALNVLVTVSTNPSVDQLSAAIGLSLMLDKLDKHATAVFSGTIPQAINFLEPGKTFENNVDSLRDFIIALDKQKADKLRYKVENNVVKIFITPYKTKITKDDFEFSQGDFNVDVVVALGVKEREELDAAIKSHGRILHDATVITVNAGSDQSKLGAINWSDPAASSLCEMLVSISESFGSGLLDQQISTAFLTGIVAATNRFSNDKTTPKVMTMSAQLMASGANQQLIANELKIDQKGPKALEQSQNGKPIIPEIKPLQEIDLGKEHDAAQASEGTEPPAAKEGGQSLQDLEAEIASLGGASKKPASSPAKDANIPLPSVSPASPSDNPSQDLPSILTGKGQGPQLEEVEKPEMGGTFNATADQAHEEAEKQRLAELNGSILHHDDLPANSGTTTQVAPIQPPAEDQANTGQIDIEAARSAVDDAVGSQPFNPSNNPVAGLGAQPLPEDNGANQQIKIDDNGLVSPAGDDGQAGNTQPPVIL